MLMLILLRVRHGRSVVFRYWNGCGHTPSLFRICGHAPSLARYQPGTIAQRVNVVGRDRGENIRGRIHAVGNSEGCWISRRAEFIYEVGVKRVIDISGNMKLTEVAGGNSIISLDYQIALVLNGHARGRGLWPVPPASKYSVPVSASPSCSTRQ